MKNSLLKKLIAFAVVVLIFLSLPDPDQTGGKQTRKKINNSLPLSLADVQKAYPQALSYNKNKDKSYNATTADGSIIGNFIVSNDFIDNNFGYAGEINTLVAFSGNIVSSVVLMDNVDSRNYVRKLYDSGLIKRWDGMEFSQLPFTNIDAVTGATLTSSAVIRAVKESSATYLTVVASSKISIIKVLKIVLFAIIIILSLIMSFRKGMSRYRTIYLIFIILASGFVLQAMLSTALLSGWLKHGLSISNSWMNITLLLLALLMPLLHKNRYYCTYLCPMGALQELTGKISPFKKLSLKILKFRYFNTSDIFLLFIVISMYGHWGIEMTNVEPFSAFAITIASWGMLIFGAVVILLSLFFNRPWCAVCPTGCAINKFGS